MGDGNMAAKHRPSHSCRSERLKFRLRNNSKDMAILTGLLDKTKSSLNFIYPQYLAERNHSLNFDSAPIDHFENTSTEKATNSKIIRERKLNNNDKVYGNVVWPQSIATNYDGEFLCTDPSQHRVLVFNREFIFKYQLGSGTPGSTNNDLDEPVDLILNQLGKLYIADKNNFRVQIFTEGRKLRDGVKQGIRSRSRSQSLRPINPEYSYSSSISLNDKPIRLVSSPLASLCACSTENGFIFVFNLMNQVVYFLKMKKHVGLSIRNICLNSNATELIYLNTDKNNDLCLRFYGLDPDQANDFGRSESSEIKRLALVRKLIFQREYLPGICLTRIGQIRIGLDLNSLVVFDVGNLSLLEYDMSGRFRTILLRAEDYLGNVLAFTFTTDQLHLAAIEVSKSRTQSKFDFKIKTYKITECECHKSMVNKKSIFVERDKSADFFQNLAESFDIFN